jgi:hypothetical protein
MAYKVKWNAVCPACGKGTGSATLKCANCSQGYIKMSNWDTNNPVMGCERCDYPLQKLLCPSCGKSIQGRNFIKTESPLIKLFWYVFVFILFLILVRAC